MGKKKKKAIKYKLHGIVYIPIARGSKKKNFPFEKESTVYVASSIINHGIKMIIIRDTKVSADSLHASLWWHL